MLDKAKDATKQWNGSAAATIPIPQPPLPIRGLTTKLGQPATRCFDLRSRG